MDATVTNEDGDELTRRDILREGAPGALISAAEAAQKAAEVNQGAPPMQVPMAELLRAYGLM